MRVIHINTYDSGGAFVAGFRFHQEMLRQGIDSKFLVLNQTGKSNDVVEYISLPRRIDTRIIESIRHRIIRICLIFIKLFLPKNAGYISLPFSPYDVNNLSIIKDADIIHLHFIANFISIYKIARLKKPIFWTLHDENAFSGLIHTDLKNINTTVDQFFRTYKKWILPSLYINFISPSCWMSKKFIKSNFYTGQNSIVIHNGITVKQKTELEHLQDKKLVIGMIMANSNDLTKGIDHAIEIINNFKDGNPFVLAGDYSSHKHKLKNNNIEFLGYINSERNLYQFLNQIDILIFTSIYDNFPNVLLEASSMGIPIIAFKVCGVEEIIQNGINGYLIKPFDTQRFLDMLSYLISNLEVYSEMRKTTQEICHKNFNISHQTMKYIKFYKENLHRRVTK